MQDGQPRISRITRMKEWYERNERRISAGSLLTGFFLDSLTLQSIDALRENLWIGTNFIIVGICIVLLNRQESNGVRGEKGAKLHFWFINIMQFAFGALLGAFFIFYFRSATLAASWPFLALLLLVMVSNELFQKRYVRLVFQVTFYYFAIFLFAIFLVPVLIGQIGWPVFVLSGLVSLLIIGLYLQIIRQFTSKRWEKSRSHLTRSILAVFLVINLLYFTNLIPPIPLSLSEAGVYHLVTKQADGSYVLLAEEKSWFEKYFHLEEEFHLPPGSSAYAYSAIYSPASISTRIIHEWQYKGGDGDWVTATEIPLFVSGGRGEGFRTYSVKSAFTPGSWRVNVATVRGQLIGRIRFKIIPVSSRPNLVTVVEK